MDLPLVLMVKTFMSEQDEERDGEGASGDGGMGGFVDRFRMCRWVRKELGE